MGKNGLGVLEALGSTQIRSYCFWDSWAMITLKGEGRVRDEELGRAVEASVEATITLP
jgi:hypothetical protein